MNLSPVHGLNGYSLAILLHLLLFVYWLGADAGVYYTSRFVLATDRPPAARAVASKIMLGIDLAPRICLVLFLPSGVSLLAASPLGRDLFGGWPLIAVWIAALVWLAIVLWVSTREGGAGHAFFYRLDVAVRGLLIVGLLGVAGYTITASAPFGVHTHPAWLGGKLALYALAIACGLMIRYRLRPFGAAFGEVLSGSSTPATEAVLHRSVAGTRPYVLAIWVCVLGSAFLGVVKPGSTAFG